MIPTDRTLDYLMQLVPKPMSRVNWTKGWLQPPSNRYTILAAQRFEMATILYQPLVFNIDTLDANVRDIRAYTANLLPLIKTEVLPSRRDIMYFHWAFSAETVTPPSKVELIDNMMEMRCGYIAFEYLCSLVAAALLSFRATKLTHDRDPSDTETIVDRYTGTADILREIAASFDVVFSEAQVCALRAEGLPMQLQRHWILFFAAYIDYKCKCHHASSYQVKLSSQKYAQTALDWLRDSSITRAQIPVVQRAYDSTLLFHRMQSVRFRCAEAEDAEMNGNAPVAARLTTQALEIIETLDVAQLESMKEVIEKCRENQKVYSQMCPVPATDEQVDEWWTHKGFDRTYCK